ncbi:MAG: glycosyltransferase family 1 protein [Thermoleophilia bacterium]
MRVAVDCHMAGQTRPGDAGNARYAVMLVHALVTAARPGDQVCALIAHAAARAQLPENVVHAAVGAGNAPRLLRGAPAALARLESEAAVFAYIAPPGGPCPTALIVHDASFLTHPEWLSPRARALLRTLVPREARRAGAVFVPSHAVAADVQAGIGVPAERIQVVSPVPAPVFEPREGAAQRVAERFGLGRYCLFVGDLGPRKNLATLAAAVDALRDPDLTLVLAGRAAGGEAALRRAPNVRMLGHVTDEELADLYAAAAVTAFPSLYEGFGLPAAEAMACGSPLVVSDRGSLPEVVGEAAIVVRPDVGTLADGLRAALEPATADRLRAAGPGRAARYHLAGMGAAAWSALRGLSA